MIRLYCPYYLIKQLFELLNLIFDKKKNLK